MAKGQRRNTSVTFTFKCSQGNTCVSGVPLGAIGDWVGRLGGDDLVIEELIYFGTATDDKGVVYTITKEGEL